MKLAFAIPGFVDESHNQTGKAGKFMFLEISKIKKHFGEGESRVEVLKGIDVGIEKGSCGD